MMSRKDNCVQPLMPQMNAESTTGTGAEHGLEKLECPVCLQLCMHPARLPCGHVFCFLCAKGVTLQSRRCALCRTEIPVGFLHNPTLLNAAEREQAEETSSDKYQWFYEGNNGWWQYDDRTNNEIEDRHKRDEKEFELLIAGFMYIVDLNNMRQYRRDNPARRRRIKRDLASAPKKGIAGLKIGSAPSREGAEGQEVDRQQMIPGQPGSDQQVTSPLLPSRTVAQPAHGSSQRTGQSDPRDLDVTRTVPSHSRDPDSVEGLSSRVADMQLRDVSDSDDDDDDVDDDEDDDEDDVEEGNVIDDSDEVPTDVTNTHK